MHDTDPPPRPLPHTVLVVEDEPVFRAKLVQAVQSDPDLQLVGEADDLPEAERLLDATRPDILLVDIGLPSGSGVRLIQRASRLLAHCQVLVITVFGEESLVMACIEAGATGYLLKGSPDVDVAAQIRTLQAGGSPVSPVIARQLLSRLALPPFPRKLPGMASGESNSELSTQEQQVLELCSKGYSYEEIARLMALSRNTIETYVKRIYRKLQVHSRSEAVFEARKLGWLRD